MQQVFENSIEIRASATVVERCITETKSIKIWLGPLLSYEVVEVWGIPAESRAYLTINLPLFRPKLTTNVIWREPGLIIRECAGLLSGWDLWECLPTPEGTLLVNRLKIEISNPLIHWSFLNLAATAIKNGMKKRIKRLKKIAETIYNQDNE